MQFLCDSVACQPDVALVELQAELREACDVEVSLQTVARSLQREGYTMKTVHCLLSDSSRLTISMKKVTRPALERNEQDHEEYKVLVTTHYCPDQLVFADESHFNRLTLRRPYAWSIRGERACRYEFFHRGTKYSMLPALSLDGVIHLEVLENAITGNDFREFVQGLLPCMNQWPMLKSVLVVDNASIHKVEGIRKMVEEHSARLLFLPSYSPDLNPIELTFSSIKSWLRANRDRVNFELDSEDGNIYDVFWEAVYSVTAEDAKGWYKHCGYHGA